MKSISFRITLSVCTFIFGIVAVTVWLNKPVPNSAISIDDRLSNDLLAPPIANEINIPTVPISESIPDSTVYSVKLCELYQNPERYTGKIIITQGIYEQGIDSSALYDSTCQASLNSGFENMKLVYKISKLMNERQSNKVRIDVVGRFNCTGSFMTSTYPFRAKCSQELKIIQFQGANQKKK